MRTSEIQNSGIQNREVQDHDAGLLAQGSTLLWTERYGNAVSARTSALERLRDISFAAALLILAGGMLGFVSWAPAAHAIAATTLGAPSL